MNAPVTVCRMTPADDKVGVKVYVDQLHLDDIPKAMDNMGWTVSAQLMRRWFATRPAWAMPQEWRRGPPVPYSQLPATQVDDQIVKMNWALKFEQVRAAMTELKAGWSTPAATDQLGKALKRAGWIRGQTCSLGHRTMNSKQLDSQCQVNSKGFGSLWDTLNDYYGAIFKATLKVAVVGKAYRNWSTGKDVFEVDQLGFYIRDTYDFNAGWIDDAFMGLGVWSKHRVLSKAEMVNYKTLSSDPSLLQVRDKTYRHFVQLRNSDFRRWQQGCKGGGDFYVFSDVHWEPYRGPAIELPQAG